MTRERILLVTFLGMCAVAGAVLYFGFFRKAGAEAPVVFGPLPALPIRPEDMIRDEDLAVFKDARFQGWIRLPAIPTVGSQGKRANPFTPLP